MSWAVWTSYRRSVRLLLLLEDPGVSLVCDFGQYGKIIATEGIGGFPIGAVLVEPRKRNVVANAVVGLVLPDRAFDPAKPEFMDGLATGRFGLGLLLGLG